jgi:hypothetical protein
MRVTAHNIDLRFMSQMNKSFPDEVGQQQWDEACRRADAIRDFLRRFAIVERVGPEMLGRNHTMGDNRTRFSDLADRSIAQSRPSPVPSQLQLI